MAVTRVAHARVGLLWLREDSAGDWEASVWIEGTQDGIPEISVNINEVLGGGDWERCPVRLFLMPEEQVNYWRRASWGSRQRAEAEESAEAVLTAFGAIFLVGQVDLVYYARFAPPPIPPQVEVNPNEPTAPAPPRRGRPPKDK